MDIRSHLELFAEKHDIPLEPLRGNCTWRSGCSKESLARRIAEKKQIVQGPVCVFSTVEPCDSFEVRTNPKTQKLEPQRRKRKCLHFYLYLIDHEFGWMHIRLQSWFPFSIQIYVNGREWLCRSLEQADIGYLRSDNKITYVTNLERAQALAERLHHKKWVGTLNAFAKRVNPLLPMLKKHTERGYYWCVEQSEFATDILFRDRASLERLMADVLRFAQSELSVRENFRFLGRKEHGAYKGEVTTSVKRRPEGWVIRFRLGANSVKAYTHANVLRIEMTMNNPTEFQIRRRQRGAGGNSLRWCKMRKGIADFWRRAQVGRAVNERVIEALNASPLQGKAVKQLDRLCRTRRVRGRTVPRLNPLGKKDLEVFRAVMAGEFAINGFRNRDIRRYLWSRDGATIPERKRRSEKVSRLIAKLRGHGLVQRVKMSRLYRLTPTGRKVLTVVIRFHDSLYPQSVAC
jgi:hypothetical protein